MTFRLLGHDKLTAVQEMLICLFPDSSHVHSQAEDGDDFCESQAEIKQGHIYALSRMSISGIEHIGEHTEPISDDADDRQKGASLSYAVKTAIFRAAAQHLTDLPPWGSLTGVKPAKPVRLYLGDGMTTKQAETLLTERFYVSGRRAKLCTAAAKSALDCKASLLENEVQVYIGIPFCPAKCSYCSFVSNDVKAFSHLMEPYVQALTGEIKAVGKTLSQRNAHIGSIYIGGGTPTTLSEAQLHTLLQAVADSFSTDCEYTVEAGRPETITKQKLKLMADFGVGRLSINPQTMHDDVLKAVGRLHSAEDFVSAYNLARSVADFEINTDLIAGLPGDSELGLFDSVRRVAQLRPDNITIHALAKKRGAPLAFGQHGQLTAEAVDRCYDHLQSCGYSPYYLYRQKYIAGNLENIGFSLPGKQCRYNIAMMEELSDVIALGSGGVTKLCSDGGRVIKRIANPKYPKEYIERMANR